MLSNIRSKIGCINYTSFLSYCTLREARFLRKMINSNRQNENNCNPKKVGVANLKPCAPEEIRNSKHQKRLEALNHVYLHYVMDIIKSTLNGNKLMELGINIFKVNLSKNYGTLNIYWFGGYNKTQNTQNIDEILSKAAVELRHEIGMLNKIGRPPFVKFVRDMASENKVVIESVFEKPEFQKDLMIADTLYDMDLNIAEEIDSAVPKMKNDAYGLNYEEFKEKILNGRKKSLRKPQEDDYDVENINRGPTIKFNKALYEKFYRRKQEIREKELRHNESLNFNPSDYTNFERKELEFDWQYGEHGEIVNFSKQFKTFTTEKQEMEKKKVEAEN